MKFGNQDDVNCSGKNHNNGHDNIKNHAGNSNIDDEKSSGQKPAIASVAYGDNISPDEGQMLAKWNYKRV